MGLQIGIVLGVHVYLAALLFARRRWSKGTLAVVAVRPYLALAHDALVRGDFEKAAAHLDAIPPQTEPPALRLIALARAELFVARGEEVAAIEACTPRCARSSMQSVETHPSPALRARVRHVRALLACSKHQHHEALSECDAGRHA